MPYTDPAFEARRKQLLTGSGSPAPVTGGISSGGGFADPSFEQRRQQIYLAPAKPISQPKVSTTPTPAPTTPSFLQKVEQGASSIGSSVLSGLGEFTQQAQKKLQGIFTPKGGEPIKVYQPQPQANTPELTKEQVSKVGSLKIGDKLPGFDLSSKEAEGSAKLTPKAQQKAQNNLDYMMTKASDIGGKIAEPIKEYAKRAYEDPLTHFGATSELFKSLKTNDPKTYQNLKDSNEFVQFGESSMQGILQGALRVYANFTPGVQSFLDKELKSVSESGSDAKIAGNTVGNIIGTIGSFVLGGEVTSALKFGKIALPATLATLGQTSLPASTPLEARARNLIIDTVSGTLLEYIKPLSNLQKMGTFEKGVEYTKQLTKSLTVLSGQTYLDARSVGASDAQAKEMVKDSALILIGLHGFMIAGKAGEYATRSSFKEGSAVFTPDQARGAVVGSNLEGTKLGNQIMKASLEAEAMGKDILIEMVAGKKSKIAGVLNLKTPEGIAVTKIEYVDSSKQSMIGSDKITPENKGVAEPPQNTPPSVHSVVEVLPNGKKTGNTLSVEIPSDSVLSEYRDKASALRKEGTGLVSMKADIIVRDSDGIEMSRMKYDDAVKKFNTTDREELARALVNGQNAEQVTESISDIAKKVRVPTTFNNPLEEKAFTKITNDSQGAVDEYIKAFENEVSPDLALTQFEGYDGSNATELTRASGTMKVLVYDDLLKSQKGIKNNTVLITGGGSGSGKTTGIQSSETIKDKYSIIVDTTFSNNSAPKDIQKALDNGYKVNVVYTLRDPVSAWEQGALKRIGEEGRVVPEGYFVQSHIDAQKNIIKAYNKYKGNKKVSFKFLENVPNGTFPEVSVDKVAERLYNRKEIAREITRATNNAYETNKITPSQYESATQDRGKLGAGYTEERISGSQKEVPGAVPTAGKPITLIKGNSPVELDVVQGPRVRDNTGGGVDIKSAWSPERLPPEDIPLPPTPPEFLQNELLDYVPPENKDKFYWQGREEGYKLVKDAKAVDVMAGVDAFISRDPMFPDSTSEWVITEGKSGMKISSGKTKKLAIEEAKTRLADAKVPIDELIQRGIKYNGSISPRYIQQASVPVQKKGTIRLYRGLQGTFDKNFDLSKTDAPNGYSTWTDNPELARQYAGENGKVYQIDLPKKDQAKELIDAEGERGLFLNNEKKAGLNGVSGNEYLVYNQHDKYDSALVKESKDASQRKNEVLGFNPKNLDNPESQVATEEVKKIVKQSDIAKTLSEKLGVPIRRGKFRHAGAIGVYKPGQKVVRIKSGGLHTVFHEVAHYLDDTIGFSHDINIKERKDLMSEYGNAYEGQPDKQRKEAFAEYVRFRMTGQTEKIAQWGPVFDKLFNEKIKTMPDVDSVIQTATEDFARWNAQPATSKILSHLSIGTQNKDSLMNRTTRALHEVYTGVFDDLHPLSDFSKIAKKNLGKIDAKSDPYVLARNLRGWVGKADLFLNNGTFGKEFWAVGDDGKIKMNFTGKGYSEIMKPVEQMKALDDFRVYIVAQRIVNDLAPRNIKSGISVEDAKTALAELNEKYPEFENIAKERRDFKDRLLEYAKDNGVIGEKGLAKIKELNKYHVPFYRVMEETGTKFLGKTKIGGNIGSPIKKIKGSEREIIDPLESDVKDVYAIINASDRNNIGIAMANISEQNFELGRLFEPVAKPMKPITVNVGEVMKQAVKGTEAEGLEIPEDLAEAIVTLFRTTYATGPNMLNVNFGDTQKVYEVDSDLFNTIQGLNIEDIGIIMKILSAPARLLRAGATLSPDFSVRNPLRDQFTAFAYSKHGFIPGVDLVRGMFELFKKGDVYNLWKAGGGEHAMFVSLDRQNLQKGLEDVLSDPNLKDTVVDVVKNPLKVLQVLSEIGEMGTRLGEMRNALARGVDPIEAAFASRNVTLDFSRIGTKTRAFNSIIAFMNANLQGTDTMVRNFKERPFQTLWKVLLGLTLPSILLYLANRKDPRWKEIPQWQKDLFWIVMTKDHVWRIPKPFELGVLFGSIPERILEVMDSKDPEKFNELENSIVSGFTPGFMPTALIPIIENITNYSFFLDRPIVGRGLEGLPAGQQSGPYTTEVSKLIGETFNISPAKIDNLVAGYSGGLGKYAVTGLDAILEGTGLTNPVAKPAKHFEELPVIKAFLIREPIGSGSESVNTIYNKYTEANAQLTYAKKLVKEGEGNRAKLYVQEHPQIIDAIVLTQVVNTFSELNKGIDLVRKSKTMNSDEKQKKIDEIQKLQTQIAERALDQLNKRNSK